MTDDDQKSDLSERFRGRFDDPTDDQEEEENLDETEERDVTHATQSEQSERSTPETTSKNAMNERNAMRAKNVKESWSATSVYLPEFLDRQMTTTYKHADLAFEEEFGRSLQKTRYYYPLLVALGMERIEEMEAKELQERIERLEGEAEQ